MIFLFLLMTSFLRADSIECEAWLTQTRVIYVGEKHFQGAAREMLLENMGVLKKSGITHLGLEALNSNHQDSLEQYRIGKASREHILNVFADEWGWSPQAHADLIDAAFAHGIAVIALDGRHLTGKISDFQERENFRDQHMTARLAQVIGAASHVKIVVLAGSNHIRTDVQPKILLTQYGIKALSYAVNPDVNESANFDGSISRKTRKPSIEESGYKEFNPEWDWSEPHAKK